MIEIIKKHPWFHFIFSMVIVAEMMGLTVDPQIRLASKGMIMATLIGFYIFTAKKQSQSFLLGMIFALLGDAFLLFTTDTFFFIGLGCFLIMQLCYAFTFWQKRRLPRTKDKLISAVLFLLPVVFLTVAWQKLGNMRVAVFLYSLSITIMLVTAYLRHPKLRGYTMVMLGSVLFVISDLFIGITKFVSEIDHSGIIIMVFYIIAQYMIVMGVLYDERPKKEIRLEPDGSFSRHKTISE